MPSHTDPVLAAALALPSNAALLARAADLRARRAAALRALAPAGSSAASIWSILELVVAPRDLAWGLQDPAQWSAANMIRCAAQGDRRRFPCGGFRADRGADLALSELEGAVSLRVGRALEGPAALEAARSTDLVGLALSIPELEAQVRDLELLAA